MASNKSKRFGVDTRSVAISDVALHHPDSIEAKGAASIVSAAIAGDESLQMIVLAADIRRSTFLMKEAVSFPRYASTIGAFVDAAASSVRKQDGWFDKFTGDGFLAYWLIDDNDWGPALGHVWTVTHNLLLTFQDQVVPDLRANSRNFPSGVGLSVGIDGGDAHFARIGKSITVVGPPVVGAVRMVTCAAPWETVANVYLGEMLYKTRGALLQDQQIEVAREFRESKEYDAQEVYPLRFKRMIGLHADGSEWKK